MLYYQPQIDTNTNDLIGCEALLRWQSPEDGLVPPDRFIPLAEETGLILPIGEWVLRDACAQLKAWLDAGFPPLALAVNLSARQMRQADWVDRVAAILRETGLPPDFLKLELTESMLMEQGDQVVARLQALKDLNLKLSIDDFGTGYSSLAYLKRFPIDELKIDRSFVRDIPEDPNDMEIAATIIAMARNLKLRVVAEGVETQEQLDFLKRQRLLTPGRAISSVARFPLQSSRARFSDRGAEGIDGELDGKPTKDSGGRLPPSPGREEGGSARMLISGLIPVRAWSTPGTARRYRA